jgi:uncharacterized membrane protein YeaQ/YmgE (transglycosylase-associated protein family)
MELLLQLLAGAVGGNVGGVLAKARSLGPLMNTILGAVGGLGGGQLATSAMDGGTGIQLGMSAVIGALLPILGAMFKKKPA